MRRPEHWYPVHPVLLSLASRPSGGLGDISFHDSQLFHLRPHPLQSRPSRNDFGRSQKDFVAFDPQIEVLHTREALGDRLRKRDLILGCPFGKHTSLPPYYKDILLKGFWQGDRFMKIVGRPLTECLRDKYSVSLIPGRSPGVQYPQDDDMAKN